MSSVLGRGLLAGAVGTTVLNMVTQVDVARRGRDASNAPARTVEALARVAGTAVPGRGRQRANRASALGTLSGSAAGLAVGVAASAARAAGVRFPGPAGAVVTGAAAMALTDVPLALLGVSDPRTWSGADWVADAVPHLAFGAATHAALGTTGHPDRPTGRAGAGLVARSAALGVAAGSRSTLGFAGPVLSSGRAGTGAGTGARTGPGAGRGARAAALLAVAGELSADKLPSAPSRLLPPSLAFRFSSGTGGALALARRQSANGAAPVVAAALGTAASSWGGLAWRRWASGRMATWQSGLLEDAVALSLAALACWTGPHRRPAPVLAPVPAPMS